ncbi:MAG: hypothetical protein M3169_10830 [Candidatus Eremiobacteraeota bacterium]|nr:hypothetical protein [Candidatus Eremiobacteraeota bacterium]
MLTVRTLAAAVCLLALSAAPSGAADAIAGGNGGTLSLGSNWGAYETYRGISFRWIDNDAEFILRGATGEARVAIACEGGPSLGRRSFALRVLDASRRQVDHVMCDGPDRRAEMLLPVDNRESRFVLHVDGGGKRIPGTGRVLNFRVFSIYDARGGSGGDVVDGRGVRLGAGWYPVEHYMGQTFRWMHNDGRLFVSVDRAQHGVLRLLLEVGPSIGARQAAVTVRDGRGRTLVRTTLVGRGVVTLPLQQLPPGEDELVIGAAGANKHVPRDPRILNLRLLSAAVQ